MTEFYVLSLLLSLLLLAFFLPLGRGTAQTVKRQRDRDNLAWFDQYQQNLAEQLAGAEISQRDHDELLAEAQKQLLLDSGPAVETEQAQTGSLSPVAAKIILLITGLLVPAIAYYLYLPFGQSLGADDQWSVRQQLNSLQQQVAAGETPLPETVNQFKQSLLRVTAGPRPDDELLLLLAQVHRGTGEFADAALRFEQLLQREPESVDLLVATAEAKYMHQMQSPANSEAAMDSAESPADLLQRALQIQPDAQRALSLAGIVAFSEKRWDDALAYWRRAEPLISPDSSERQTIRSGIAAAEARLAGGSSEGLSTTQPGIQQSAQATPKAFVRLEISADLPAGIEVPPATPVFVFARSGESPMPVAAQRLRYDQLPAEILLTDLQRMAGQGLEQFDQVVVTARLALGGKPIASSGDYSSVTINAAVNRFDKDINLAQLQARIEKAQTLSLTIRNKVD